MSGQARGAAGRPATWAGARKQAVGTVLSGRSRAWSTTAEGVLTEVYDPNVDCPNQRDLQLLITGGGGLFHEARRDMGRRRIGTAAAFQRDRAVLDRPQWQIDANEKRR